MSDVFFKKLLLVIIVIMICAAFVLRLSSLKVSGSALQSSHPTTPPASVDNATEGTFFTGEYVCLPHRDTSGPQTMECAFGLKLADGKYIAVDLGSNSGAYAIGKSYQMSGTFVPIQAISSDMWQRYPVEGILRVENVYNVKVK